MAKKIEKFDKETRNYTFEMRANSDEKKLFFCRGNGHCF